MDWNDDELVKRARELAPLLRAHAQAAEQTRQPADEVIEALRQARLFDIMVPRVYGGLELDLDHFLEVGLALGEGDASMAWVATFYIEHNWMLCQFPESFQKVLYAERSHILAPASLSPGGQAIAEPGGHRISGRWQWSTGIVHADWVLVGVVIQRESEDLRDVWLFALPRADVELIDTWHTDGMAGTGSHDVKIDGVFVPEDRSVDVTAMASGTADGARIHSGPLYQTPMVPILALAASMPALGQARACVRSFQERMTKRHLYGAAGQKQSDRPAAQIRLARAAIQVRQAELLMRDVVHDVMKVRNRATPQDRARWTGQLAYVVDQCKRVLQSLAEASGASAHFLDNPLQRALRDVNVIATHVVFDLDQRLEIHGRGLLGLDPGGLV